MAKKSNRGKNVVVTKESESGRNLQFKDTNTGRNMNRQEFVEKIKRGSYPNYHTRNINGVSAPVSNPDSSEGNNLD